MAGKILCTTEVRDYNAVHDYPNLIMSAIANMRSAMRPITLEVEVRWMEPADIRRLRELEDENRRLSLGWNLNRTLSKLNYRIHTDAIKAHIIPTLVSQEQANYVYANEADVLNVALFGQTAKEWRDTNPNQEGSMREYATIEQLLVLANIEAMNAEFIRMGLPQNERLNKLNEIAITQLKSLTAHSGIGRLSDGNNE